MPPPRPMRKRKTRTRKMMPLTAPTTQSREKSVTWQMLTTTTLCVYDLNTGEISNVGALSTVPATLSTRGIWSHSLLRYLPVRLHSTGSMRDHLRGFWELIETGVESATTSKLEPKLEIKTKKSARAGNKSLPNPTTEKANMVLFVSVSVAMKHVLPSMLADTSTDAVHPLGNKWSPHDRKKHIDKKFSESVQR
jgi:hypothetical protein